MWILRYQYDLADGNPNKVSCCLKRGETYNIGRSSKNLLNVKNDKSISREHISISWENESNQLKLVNQGKMTAASGRYLKIGESTNFGKSMKTILIELGTKPLTIQVQWLVSNWIIPYESLTEFAFLEEFGIELSSSDLKKANVIVMSEQPDYRQWLYGSVKEIPLMNLAFLDRLRFYFASNNGTRFDSFWSEIMNDESLRYTSKRISTDVLKDLEFFTIGKDEEDSLAIEAAGGKYSSIMSLEELQDIIKKRENTDNIVIIRSPSTSSELMIRGKTFTMQDVVEAIFKEDVNSLKNVFPRNIIERSKDERQVEKVIKKRRLNRPRVKPLDILSFFAGGDSMKDSRESTMKLDSQVKESKKQKKLDQSSRERSVESEKQQQGLQGGSTVVLTPKIPSELNEKSMGDSEHEESRITNKRISMDADIEPQGKVMEEPSRDTENPVPSLIIEKSKGMVPRRNPTLHYQNTDAPSEKEMVQIIQDTKNREVRRLNSTIIQIGDEELTEDAINQLGNLVLVDRNDRLLRHRDRTPVNLDIPNPDWSTRKNFKNFVKVMPKYRGSKNPSQEGSSDTIRKRAFLLTREYVSTKTYNANGTSKKVEDNIEEDVYDSPRLQAGAQLEPQVENPAPKNLFVTDEEDSQDIVLEEPGRPLSPSLSHLLSDKHVDSDSDDDEPKFEFKRHR